MNYTGEISALLTAFLWSWTSIFFSEAGIRVGSVQVNITRLILAGIYLLVTIVVMNYSLALSSMQVFYLVLSGMIGLVFGDTYLFKAFQHIGPRLSMLIMSLSPAIAALIAYFALGETLSVMGIIGIVITLVGISLVVIQKEEHPTSKYKISRIGIFYAFLGAVGQGAGLIFAKQAFNLGPINEFSATFIRISSSVIIMLPVGIMAGKYQNPFTVYKKEKTALAYTIGGSICGPYLGITLSLLAISHTKVGIASTIMSTVPILLLPIVRFVYKEKLTWKSVVGAVVCVAGVAILFLI
ncbi:MAG: DMT family transporter [Ignavibacteriales bacterium]|nr:MAG: DMT family transporter [Ignavibacteriales bacterium]